MVARAGKGWKLAAALITLEDQVNAKYPGRNKSSDGSIGDLAHSSRASDHNVRNGYCHAIDITHDPKYGFDSYRFADHLLAVQDPRLSYIISNRRIGSGPAGPSPGKWRAYKGANPHDHHVHISVDADGETDARPWNIGDKPVVAQPAAPAVLPLLRLGSKGVEVRNLQRALLLPSDGIFGQETRTAVIKLQQANSLIADGVVGPQTWKLINLRGKI